MTKGSTGCSRESEPRGERAKPRYRYGYVDHTADVGIRLEAASLPALFCAAMEAVLHLLLERPPRCGDVREQPSPDPFLVGETGAVDERRIVLDAPDLPGLLVRWLNEVLYQVQVGEVVPVRLWLRVWHGAGGVPAGPASASPPPEPAGHTSPGGHALGSGTGESGPLAGSEGAPEGAGRGPVPPAPAGWKLEAVMGVVPLDTDAMGWQGEIKAATYHGLEVTPVGDPPHGWKARVILDV